MIAHAPQYQNLLARLKELSQLDHILQLLAWDQEIYMPRSGGQARAEQVGYLTELRHARMTAPDHVAVLSELRSNDKLAWDEAVVVREAWRDVDRLVKVPGDLVRRLSEQRSKTYMLWIEAREKNSFSVVRDDLKISLDLTKEWADIVADGESRYETLVRTYQPGAKIAAIDTIFSQVRPDLVALLARIFEKTGGKLPDNPARSTYPAADQRGFCREVVSLFGYDFDAGRLDETAHPFCCTVGPQDVRLATKFHADDILPALKASIHEAGHGLYDQGFQRDYWYTPLAEAVSLGIHESQSLIWEKQVGCSRWLWNELYPQLQSSFPSALAGVPYETFFRYLNRVGPSLIRVEADEVAYGLHILIRYEVEKALVSGDLAMEDVSGVWNEQYRNLLGLEVPDDRAGVLQDVHWYHGTFGYFPTYLLGAMGAAQLYVAFEKNIWKNQDGDIEAKMELLRHWLRENIHAHGRRYNDDELFLRATGSALKPDALVQTLARKYSELHSL